MKRDEARFEIMLVHFRSVVGLGVGELGVGSRDPVHRRARIHKTINVISRSGDIV